MHYPLFPHIFSATIVIGEVVNVLRIEDGTADHTDIGMSYNLMEKKEGVLSVSKSNSIEDLKVTKS
jgi:hypothetical protein